MRDSLNRLKEWLLYEKVFTGTTERNGVVFKKYSKIRRFRSSHRRLLLLILAALLGLLLLQKILRVILTPKRDIDYQEQAGY